MADGDSQDDGFVLADKPAGRTSHDITAFVRRELGIRKAGHAGTLDPFATGLMVILTGRARRVQRFVAALPKEYVAIARFGAVSTTGDPDGEITQTGVLPQAPLELPLGTILQRPPVYSAVHVDGRRAYQRARAGETFEIPEREVTIHECELLWQDEDRAALRIVCSSGTYVRSLVAELGDAYTEELRRTRIGPFDVEEADPGLILPLQSGLVWFAQARLEGDVARRAGHGVLVAAGETEIQPPTWEPPGGAPEEVLLVDDAGPIALAQRLPDGDLKPFVGFRS